MLTNKGTESDIVLIGAGIMSATLGLLLKELNSNATIEIFERLDSAANESSDAMNNAGTGHAAFCELNYTPEKNGVIDTTKALDICEQFEESRQFWSYLVKKNIIQSPKSFVNSVPHMSFVWGDKNIDFLKKRHQALKNQPLFSNMLYSEDKATIQNWAPLIMQNRNENDKVAATYMDLGTDVNFGELTRKMINHQVNQNGVNVTFDTEVYDLKKTTDGKWNVYVKNIKTGEKRVVKTKFVFIGAGGASILLLKKSGIPEGNSYGGFPVSGQWLVCEDENLAAQHFAKVYGLASVGAPPMSVPHLDTRFVNGKKSLLFGPYAGFSTKFLKTGSYWDLFSSISTGNIGTMVGAGLDNMALTKYLISEVLASPDKKMASLKEYFPNANPKDWRLEIAGQRVQTMKRNSEGKPELAFGTEVVSAADGSLAVLLGASPGASTTVTIMLKLIEKCFVNDFKSAEWQAKFKEMIPSFGLKLNDHPELLKELRAETSKTLELKY
ncbi:malate dehydrogenase (quinone) [Myroides sp. JBRI-B21084]|uniref:malate dehydrogenase (quinone) n=1 Tax=Myroides sp. JBRI-B21084 TaxID=3119977 RepID=UPI0026E37DF6|nr:malate dehydrogenase (quinone) [Paenimyroides cloacae]WKW45720.1 malate dehydrogenase (quinone) [Paenimyroides cloacae]